MPALFSRCMCCLIPCQCNPQAIGFIYCISPLLDHLLKNPLLPITSKIIRLKEGKKQCALPQGCFNAAYSICELIRSVQVYEVSP